MIGRPGGACGNPPAMLLKRGGHFGFCFCDCARGPKYPTIHAGLCLRSCVVADRGHADHRQRHLCFVLAESVMGKNVRVCDTDIVARILFSETIACSLF